MYTILVLSLLTFTAFLTIDIILDIADIVHTILFFGYTYF